MTFTVLLSYTNQINTISYYEHLTMLNSQNVHLIKIHYQNKNLINVCLMKFKSRRYEISNLQGNFTIYK